MAAIFVNKPSVYNKNNHSGHSRISNSNTFRIIFTLRKIIPFDENFAVGAIFIF